MCEECKELIENMMAGELDRVHLYKLKGKIQFGLVACENHANEILNLLAKATKMPKPKKVNVIEE